MSVLQGMEDVSNAFLSRREITCNFSGLGGRLTKLEATDMVVKEYSLDGKIVIPISLRNHVGNDQITGTFYVYEDETLAKSHVDPTVFARLEKAKAKVAEKEKEAASKEAEDKPDAKEESAESSDNAKAEDKPDAKESGNKPDAEDKPDAKESSDKPDAKEENAKSADKPEQKAEAKEEEPKSEGASS